MVHAELLAQFGRLIDASTTAGAIINFLQANEIRLERSQDAGGSGQDCLVVITQARLDVVGNNPIGTISRGMTGFESLAGCRPCQADDRQDEREHTKVNHISFHHFRLSGIEIRSPAERSSVLLRFLRL